jgi:SWIM/SEC-C metal-binding protein
MSKLFFKGRIDPRENYQRFGYNTKREKKLGSANLPLSLKVTSELRKKEVEVLLGQHNLQAIIEIDAESAENLLELDALLNKPKTQVVEITPKRNDPCSCGSTKKFKKCCG